MCIFKKIKEIYMNHLNNKVEYYWNIYHFDMEPKHTSYNNEGDAFKHCYSQAEFTLFLGAKIAKFIGDKHEENNPYNTPEEKAMDLHNNKQGRIVGKEVKKNIFWLFTNWEDKTAKLIMDKMNNGELITKP